MVNLKALQKLTVFGALYMQKNIIQEGVNVMIWQDNKNLRS